MADINKDFSTLLRIEAIKGEIIAQLKSVNPEMLIRDLMCELVEEAQKLTK